MKTRVEITRQPGLSLPRGVVGLLRRAVTLTLEQAGRNLPVGVVSVALVSDAQIAELNRHYLDRDGPTDVLAFNLMDQARPRPGCQAQGTEDPALGGPGPEGRELVWGEIVLSVDTARRQAPTSLEKELCLLAMHGTLHLLGWEDDTRESWQQMMEETHRLLNLLTGNGQTGEG